MESAKRITSGGGSDPVHRIFPAFHVQVFFVLSGYGVKEKVVGLEDGSWWAVGRQVFFASFWRYLGVNCESCGSVRFLRLWTCVLRMLVVWWCLESFWFAADLTLPLTEACAFGW